MKLWSYTIVRDTGLAPNPFGGCCTLALCTPNYMGINADVGNWILGHGTVATGNRLILLMQINEKMTFHDYYTCGRFEHKKPVKGGDWKSLVGDNIYYKENGKYDQHKPNKHDDDKNRAKDLKYADKKIVFISGNYFYFGKDSIEPHNLPEDYSRLIFPRHGVKGSHDPEVVEVFLQWMKSNYKTGRHANPRDAHKPSRGCDKP